MKVSLLFVGKERDGELGPLVATYLKRCEPVFSVSVTAVKPYAVRTDHQIALARDGEGERLLARVPSGSSVVALDVGGSQFSSEQFAARLDAHRSRGQALTLIIGGAFGLGPAVLAAAEWRLSLSPLTLPHRVAQLVLAEQLYRAKTLLAGEPYHK